jgi:hypothetical protein
MEEKYSNILNKEEGRVWNGLIWFRIGSGGF